MSEPITRRPALRLSSSGQELIDVFKIRRDGGTQPRAGIDEAHVARLIEAIEQGNELPPVILYFDGEKYWLADGFHRVQAHTRLKGHEAKIPAEIHQGDRRAAVLHSVGANRSHGLPRSRADLQRAIETLLRDKEWVQWSDREISRQVGCSDKTVASARARLSAEIPQIETRTVARNGTTYTQAPKTQPDPREAARDQLVAEFVSIQARGATLADRERLLQISLQADQLGLINVGLEAMELASNLATGPSYRHMSTGPAFAHWQARAEAVGASLSREGDHAALRLPEGPLCISESAGHEDLIEEIERLEGSQNLASVDGDLPVLPEGWHWRTFVAGDRLTYQARNPERNGLTPVHTDPEEIIRAVAEWETLVAEMAVASAPAAPPRKAATPGPSVVSCFDCGATEHVEPVNKVRYLCRRCHTKRSQVTYDLSHDALMRGWSYGYNGGQIKIMQSGVFRQWIDCEDGEDFGGPEHLARAIAWIESRVAAEKMGNDVLSSQQEPPPSAPTCTRCNQLLLGGVAYSGQCPGCYHLGMYHKGDPAHREFNLREAQSYTERMPDSEFRELRLNKIAEFYEDMAYQGSPAPAPAPAPIKAELPASAPEPDKDHILAVSRGVFEAWVSDLADPELELLAAAVWRHFNLTWHEANRKQRIGHVVDRLLGGLEAEYNRDQPERDRLAELIDVLEGM